MNSLNINLKEGQKIVMQGNIGTEEQRTVELTGGFGMHSFTAGTTVFVDFPNGTSGKMNAMEIEKVVEDADPK